MIKFSRIFGMLTLAVALCAPAWPQQAAAGPQWKDRAEYDLYEAITKETNAAKKLELLNSWKEKYPATEFKQPRNLLFLDTYRQLNRTADVIGSAKEILAADPKDATALYWIATLAPFTNDTSPAALDLAEKAAKGLLENLDVTFAKEKKPGTTTDEQWAKARKDIEILGHKTLGWAAMIRKNTDESEKQFKAVLGMSPGDAQVSYWLAQTVAGLRKVERMPEALWHYARAASYEGPGALAPAGRKEIDAYLTKAYTGFHGDASGLAELKTQARSSPMPPAGWTIKSVKAIAEEKFKAEQAAEAADPQRALWKRIKEALTGAEGQQYFESSMKDSKPDDKKTFRGKVVQATPANRPKEITLAMSDDTTPEATLKFENPIAVKAEPGTVVEFTATAKSFTKEPFMVVFEAERADVSGLAAAAPARPAPAKRPAARPKRNR